MDAYEEVLISLGRIEGRLIEIGSLSQRVSKIEVSLSWLKGAWASLLAAFAWVWKAAYAR